MNKDFLKLSDLNKDEVLCLLKEAEELKQLKASGVAHRTLEVKTL